MRRGEVDDPLAPAFDDAPHDPHVGGPRGDRLAVSGRIRQSAEHVPPVGDDGDQPRHGPAGLELVRGEAGPAPLVLELVEVVLAVAPVAVELRQGHRIHLLVIRDEDAVVPFAAPDVLHEVELRLLHDRRSRRDESGRLLRDLRLPAGFPRLDGLDRLLGGTPYEQHTPSPMPPVELDPLLQRLPARTALLPSLAAGQDPEQLLDVPRPLDLEEIENTPRLRLAHGRVVAVADVAAQERRQQVRRKRVDESPEPLHAATAKVLLAGPDVHAERDAGPADEERVVVMARPSGLDRVVAELRALLVPVDRLDRVVDVDDVPVHEQGLVHLALVPRKPGVELLLVRPPERPPDRRVRDDLAQSEQLPRGLVVADRLDVDVPCLPEQDREDGRADDVAFRAGVVALVVDREVLAKPVEETCLLKERREVDEPSDRRDALSGRPVNLETASERGHVHCGSVELDEILRLRHLKPERWRGRITHVAFPFFRDLICNSKYTKKGSATLPFADRF